ncbi:hypothetical protein [Companilactobacillus mishanensis]|uniref:Uncharacterized protein n=2 Tax=Companilactobacillus mishanensis TaxID=2486008 RepID=A0ABW9P5R5_9LACO|nr:hypothetical protein [Companilactobacillus mishanensis]MQS44534.1 hypothetical protein [Companilactobacillus mishanensis]
MGYPVEFYNMFKNSSEYGDAKNLGGDVPKEGMLIVGSSYTPTFDNGMSIQTGLVNLEKGQNTSFSFLTYMENPTSSHSPFLYLDQHGTKGRPTEIGKNDEYYQTSGNWHYKHGNNILIYYSLDNENFDEAIPFRTNSSQDKNDMKSSKPHPWEKIINLQRLSPGLHTIRFWAKDTQDRTGKAVSQPVEDIVDVKERFDGPPLIFITSPLFDSDLYNPFESKKSFINLKGTWFADPDAKVKISYSFKGDKKNQLYYLDDSLINKNTWHIDNLNIFKFSDGLPHEIDFEIHDNKNHLPGKTSFTFIFSGTNLSLEIPEKFNFGKINVMPHINLNIKPDIIGNLIINDRRLPNSKHVYLKLDREDFIAGDKKLNSKLVWKDKIIPTSSQFVLDTFSPPTNVEHFKETDYTEELKKYLSLQIDNFNPSESGHYTSKFSWSLEDTI